jgi:hypothetical protein
MSVAIANFNNITARCWCEWLLYEVPALYVRKKRGSKPFHELCHFQANVAKGILFLKKGNPGQVFVSKQT